MFNKGNDHDNRHRGDGAMSNESNNAMSMELKSTGKDAKKRRVGIVVGDDEAEDEDDDEDDDLMECGG